MTNPVARFQTAVSVLAGDGHIKQRLISAFQDNLADVEEDMLPLSLRESFEELRARMYGVAPLNGEGPICASVRKMSAMEASECAGSVVTLYGELLRQTDASDASSRISAEDTRQVPPFLVNSAS